MFHLVSHLNRNINRDKWYARISVCQTERSVATANEVLVGNEKALVLNSRKQATLSHNLYQSNSPIFMRIDIWTVVGLLNC